MKRFEHENRLSGEAVEAPSLKIFKTWWVTSWATCSGWPCLRLDSMVSRGPTQPHPFCGSRIKLTKESKLPLWQKTKARITVFFPLCHLIHTEVPPKSNHLLFKWAVGVFQVVHCQCSSFDYFRMMLSAWLFLLYCPVLRSWILSTFGKDSYWCLQDFNEHVLFWMVATGSR